MASFPPTALAPDPELIGGPAPLVGHALGVDELDERFSENPEYLVRDPSGSDLAFLRELVDFNQGRSTARPVAANHARVRLYDPRADETSSVDYVLKFEEELAPFRARYLLLRRRPAELPRPSTAGADLLDQLSALADATRVEDIVLVLDGMILDREIALSTLRDLVGMHRDAVQNAVDIVQTKRVDFLENPQESSILDYAFGLVMGALAAAAVSTVLGVMLELVGKGVLTVLGRSLLRGNNAALSALITKRGIELNLKHRALARLRPMPTNRRNPAAAKARTIAALKSDILALRRDNENANRAFLTLDGIAADARTRSKALRERLSRPVRPDGTPDWVHSLGSTIVEETEAKARQVASAVEQSRADNAARPIALPIDIAMKMEVQDYFAPWLGAADATVHYLRQARLALLRNGELPQDAIAEIVSLAAEAAGMDEFARQADDFAESSPDPRADMTSFYELLLWLTMYRSQLSHVPRAFRSGSQLHVDKRTGKLLGPIDSLTDDTGTLNLLRYLSQRFMGKGRIKGGGQDAELVFTRKELIETHRRLENLCAEVFQPKTGSRRAADPVGTLRLVRTSYDSWWLEKLLD